MGKNTYLDTSGILFQKLFWPTVRKNMNHLFKQWKEAKRFLKQSTFFYWSFLCNVHIKIHWNNWIANWNKYKGTGTIRKQYFWLIDKNIIGNLKNIRLSWNRNKIWSWMHLYFTKIYIFHVIVLWCRVWPSIVKPKEISLC